MILTGRAVCGARLKLYGGTLYLRERRAPTVLQSIFNSLFGCAHQRTTFPITPGKKTAGISAAGALRNGTYVACLECGKEFAYDWHAMKVVSGGFDRGEALAAAESLATK